MAKQEFKPLSWKVKNFDFNKQVIVDYNVLKYRENDIKKMKKQCVNKEEFAEKLRREFQYYMWCRAEWELIIELTEDERVLLRPWVGCRDDELFIDVTDDTTFDWKGFAAYHIGKQVYKNKAKIDAYSQLTYGENWDRLVTYLWTTRLKYERDHPKFHEQ